MAKRELESGKRKLETEMNKRFTRVIYAIVLLVLAHLPLAAKGREADTKNGGEEFFIISSVDLAKKQLFLKHPTEVTELVLLGDSTVCFDEHSKAFPCNKLRAGDTVFVTAKRATGSTPTALRIRLGGMTVDEVHRKYMGAR